MSAKANTPTVSPLEAHAGYWLRFVSNHASHAFSRKVAARGVTVAEWVVLRELFDTGSAAPSHLAGRLGMTRGAITKLADRLIAKAMLLRRRDRDDGRAQTLTLTGKGRALVPELAALADRNDAEFFGHLTAAERQWLERMMKEIVRRHALRAVPVV